MRNKEIEEFADYLIDWIVSKNDVGLPAILEFNIVRIIVECVEMYVNKQSTERNEGARE